MSDQTVKAAKHHLLRAGISMYPFHKEIVFTGSIGTHDQHPIIFLSLSNAPLIPSDIHRYLEFSLATTSCPKDVIPIVTTGYLYRHSFAAFEKCSMKLAIRRALAKERQVINATKDALKTLPRQISNRFSLHGWEQVVTYAYFQKIKLFRSLYQKMDSPLRECINGAAVRYYQKRIGVKKLPDKRRLSHQVNFFLEELPATFFSTNLNGPGSDSRRNYVIYPIKAKKVYPNPLCRPVLSAMEKDSEAFYLRNMIDTTFVNLTL